MKIKVKKRHLTLLRGGIGNPYLTVRYRKKLENACKSLDSLRAWQKANWK